ncbi:hypothetical protein GCM10025734_62410 [Kitasatospora paranensis]|uniref:hypothetical protein n=1 Tax=Kitasatospora paranensis TaxID=258053 RepID=UPI0031E9594F
MKHRTSHRASIIGRTAGRLGVLSAACLTALAVAAPADAVPFSSHPGRGVAAFADHAATHASRVHPDQYDDSFTVHELGSVYSVGANNRATAVSAGCSTQHPCRSIALSFQIVTMAGDNVRLNATNLGRAINEQCPGCQTLAGAYQFIVSTPQPFRLSQGPGTSCSPSTAGWTRCAPRTTRSPWSSSARTTWPPRSRRSSTARRRPPPKAVW